MPSRYVSCFFNLPRADFHVRLHAFSNAEAQPQRDQGLLLRSELGPRLSELVNYISNGFVFVSKSLCVVLKLLLLWSAALPYIYAKAFRQREFCHDGARERRMSGGCRHLPCGHRAHPADRPPVMAHARARKQPCVSLLDARQRQPPAWCFQLATHDCEAHYVRQSGGARRCVAKGKRCVAGPLCQARPLAPREPSACVVQEPPARDGTRTPSLCFLLARWGGWPPWFPLTLRGMAANPTVDFLLLGDRPVKHTLPHNVRFHSLRSAALVSRLRNASGVWPAQFALTGWGHTAKVNDLKPLFGLLFADILQTCDWWVTMQDDMLLGNVRSFLTADLLSRHDLVSPLPAPFFHSGPFMAYRNVQRVNLLWQRSADWQWVLQQGQYTVFDEWWGPAADRDNMPRVVQREAAAGRVRAFTPPDWAPGRQRWMIEDFVHGPNGSRWFDESLVVVWRRGKLRYGEGDAPRRACDDLLFAHFMHAKRREQVARLPHTKWLAQLASVTDEILLTAEGFWVKGAKTSSKPSVHWLVSGRSPSAIAAVSSSGIRDYVARVTKLQPADTVQPVPEGLRLLLGGGQVSASLPPQRSTTERNDWLLSSYGQLRKLVPCAQAIRIRLADSGAFASPCKLCTEIVERAKQRLSRMQSQTCAEGGPTIRSLSDVFRLECRTDAKRKCAAALGLAVPLHQVQSCGLGRSPSLSRVRACPTCASVSVARGAVDKGCCHVPGGGWAERCGEAVGEASCGDDGLQPCEYASRPTPHAPRPTPHAPPHAPRPARHAPRPVPHSPTRPYPTGHARRPCAKRSLPPAPPGSPGSRVGRPAISVRGVLPRPVPP